jgi:cell division protein FtsB
MNFNLTKYLALSVAGLASMHSDAMMTQKYNMAPLLNLQSKDTPSVLTLTNLNTAPLRGSKFLSVQSLSQLLQTVFPDTQVQQLAGLYSRTNNINQNINDISTSLLEHARASFIRKHLNLIQQLDKKKYIVGINAKQTVLEIFTLLELVQNIYNHNANCNSMGLQQIPLQPVEGNSGVVCLLWNMLLSMKDNYEEFYQSLITDYTNYTGAIRDIKNDAGIGALIERILNSQNYYISQQLIEHVAMRVYRTLCSSDNPQNIFRVLTNNKINCLVSTFEPFKENPVFPNVVSQFGINNFQLGTTNEVLQQIGFTRKLTESEMYMVDLLLRNVQLPTNLRRVRFNQLKNVGDLAIYLDYVLHNPNDPAVVNVNDYVLNNNVPSQPIDNNMPIQPNPQNTPPFTPLNFPNQNNTGNINPQKPDHELLTTIEELQKQNAEQTAENERLKSKLKNQNQSGSGDEDEKKGPVNDTEKQPTDKGNPDDKKDGIFIQGISEELAKNNLKIKEIHSYKTMPNHHVDLVINDVIQQRSQNFYDLVKQPGVFVFDFSRTPNSITRQQRVQSIKGTFEKRNDIPDIMNFYKGNNYLEFVIE